jgi:hypothetical protein
MSQQPQYLPPVRLGTASNIELALWVAAAACACTAALFAIGTSMRWGDKAAAVCVVSMAAAVWALLVIVCAIGKRLRQPGGSLRRYASERAALDARDDLLFWSMFTLIVAPFLLLTLPPIPGLVWVLRAMQVINSSCCALAVIRCLFGLISGRYIQAVLTLSRDKQGPRARIQVNLPGLDAGGLYDALFELVEVPPEQDMASEAGMLGAVVMTAHATAEMAGAACFRFDFVPLDERVFELAKQGLGSWTFSASSKITYWFIRVTVQGAGRIYYFAWR